MPIFGRSDGLMPDVSTGTTPFYIARQKTFEAAAAFAEAQPVDKSQTMLEERFRSALVPLLAHFQGIEGKSVRLTATQQMNAISDTVISILQSPGVAKVFSVSPADARWPFNSDDPNGAKLVENASSKLSVPQECKLAFTKFIMSQRVGRQGAEALRQVLTANPDSEQELLALISQVYRWGTSLHDFQQMR